MNSSAPDSRLSRPEPSNGAPADEVDLLALVGVLWRAKWLIALLTSVAVAAGVFYLLRVAVPIYTATAVVAFENREEQVTDLESVIAGLSSDQASINTEIEVIRSRQLLGAQQDLQSLVLGHQLGLYQDLPASAGRSMLPLARN